MPALAFRSLVAHAGGVPAAFDAGADGVPGAAGVAAPEDAEDAEDAEDDDADAPDAPDAPGVAAEPDEDEEEAGAHPATAAAVITMRAAVPASPVLRSVISAVPPKRSRMCTRLKTPARRLWLA